MDLVFTHFGIKSTSDESLEVDAFTVSTSYQNDNLLLKIDLRHVDPIMADQSVSGLLSISNMALDRVEYKI